MKKAIYIGILLTFILGFSMIGTAQAVTYEYIWATPSGEDRGTVYALWIEDTDNDTKEEVLAGAHFYGGGLWVYETTGDDSFADAWNSLSAIGLESTWYDVSVGDADKDGKKEIIGGGREAAVPHYVWVLEWTGTVGDNDYELVWNHTFPAFVEGARVTDLDKDGAREIVVATGADENFNVEGLVRVFECTGDNTYELEWSFNVTTLGAGAIHGIECGDIDNDGWPEIAVECEAHLLVLNSSTHQATPHLEWGPIALPSTGSWGGIDVSTEKGGFSQDLDNDGLKEIAIGCYDRVAIYENLGPDSYSSVPVNITFVGINYIELDIAWDLDNNTKNELLCGGGISMETGNVSIFEFGSTLDDFTLVFTDIADDAPNSIRASNRMCHPDLDEDGYYDFALGLYYTAPGDVQVWESDVGPLPCIPEFPTWPLLFVMLLAITTATIPIRRRIRH